MRTHRSAFVPLGAACLLALLSSWAPALAAGPSREFKGNNVIWTLPSNQWEFKEVGEEMHGMGFLVKAVAGTSDRTPIEALLYVKESEGLTLTEIMQEMRAQQGNRLNQEIWETKVVNTTLAGHPAQAVLAAGRAQGGSVGHLRWYMTEHRGIFYGLLIDAWNGAHRSKKDDLNALRQGLRLIQGSKKEDAPEPLDELAAVEAEHAGDTPASPSQQASSNSGGWPPNGPRLEEDGRKIVLPDHNFEWKLPESSPFQWRDPIRDLKDAYAANPTGGYRISPMVRVAAQLERKKQEFEKDTPDVNACTGILYVCPTPEGRNPREMIRQSRFQKALLDRVGLHNEQASHTRIVDSMKLGNHEATHFQTVAEDKRGQEVTFLFFESTLRGMSYQWVFSLTGHTDRFQQFQKPIGALLLGVHFPDSTEFVRGPILPPETIATFSAQRGEDADAEKVLRAPGIEFEKPKGLFDITPPNRSAQAPIWMAVEGRSKDGLAYLYFDVHMWPMKELRKYERDLEALATQRADLWESSAGEETQLSSRSKPPHYRQGSFGRAKGVTYEFTTKNGGVPYVEEGYFVEEKQHAYWFRFQYGGEKATDVMEKLAKEIRRNVKWVR